MTPLSSDFSAASSASVDAYEAPLCRNCGLWHDGKIIKRCPPGASPRDFKPPTGKPRLRIVRNGPDRKRVREVYERYGWRCGECGIDKRLSIHHIKHRAHGGSNDLDNLMLLCWTCHRAKHEDN